MVPATAAAPADQAKVRNASTTASQPVRQVSPALPDVFPDRPSALVAKQFSSLRAASWGSTEGHGRASPALPRPRRAQRPCMPFCRSAGNAQSGIPPPGKNTHAHGISSPESASSFFVVPGSRPPPATEVATVGWLIEPSKCPSPAIPCCWLRSHPWPPGRRSGSARTPS